MSQPRKRYAFVLPALLLFLCAPAQAALIELAPEARQSTDFRSLRQIEPILRDVAALRDLPVLRPIQVGVLDRTQLQAKLAEQIKTEIPADKLRAEEALYRQLGMLPTDFKYESFLLELYTEQIGGFYDPKTSELKLIKGTPLGGMEQQMLIAHELTHALQDQHYDLKKFLDPASDNDDRTLAQAALIEGDATVAAMEYLQERAAARPFQGILEMLGSVFSAARQMQSFEKFRAAPRFIQDSLTFPYDQGAQFVTAFRQQGWSWRDVGTLYRQPPTATEHILHPQTYMAGDVPQPVQMSLKSLLPGSRVLSSSVWGELSYRQFLGHHLGWKDAKAAAEGWQGDRYEVLETPDGLVFAFFSLWDDEAEAEAFFASWRKALAVRSAAAMPAAGGTVDIGQKRTWAEIKGRGVAIVESLSVAQTARISAIAAAWREASSQSVPLSQPLRRPD